MRDIGDIGHRRGSSQRLYRPGCSDCIDQAGAVCLCDFSDSCISALTHINCHLCQNGVILNNSQAP